MTKTRLSGFMMVAILAFSAMVMIGCSGTRDISKEDETEVYSSKDANGHKGTQEFVSTSSLTEKVLIDKENLEAISSSLAGFISSQEFSGNLDKDEVMFKIIEYINTPYLWGGTSKRGIDCSAFIQTVYYQALGVTLPRTSLEQSSVGEPVEKSELKFGDLVFFDTMRKGRVSHVGMYLGNGFFAHSGSRAGVSVASLEDEFYTRTYLKAKRVLEN
jgi:hypothetical protein